MSTNPTQLSTFAIEKEKNNNINFKNVINNYKHHWYLFLFTIIITLIIAFIYLQYAEPTYAIRATLLINEDKKSIDNQEPQQSVLNKIDLPNSAETTENEIAKLKSINLISQVITDLQLSTSYKMKQGLFYHDLYITLPFKLTLLTPNPKPDDKTHPLKIQVKDANSYLLENANGKLEVHKFKTKVTSDIGTWKLEPTPAVLKFKDSSIKVTVLDPEKLASDYQKSIEVGVADKLSSAVDLTLSDHIKQRGKDILNHLIYVYNNAEVQEKNKETQSTINFIDQRLASLTGELTGVEKNIETFKSSNQLTDIDNTSKYNLNNLQANDAKLNEINVQLSIVNGIEKYINSPENKGRAPAAIGIADPTLVTSIEKLSQLELQREQMLATTPETNPDFDQINRQIQTTKASIKENVQNIKSSLNNALDKLQSVNTKVESTITNIPGQEREYLSIKRQQSIKENLYIYLLQKREEVSLNYATTVKNYRVIDNAFSGPLKWPLRSVVYAIAFILGLLFPMIYIYFKDKVNAVIINPEEIEDELKIPILSDISINRTKDQIVINDKSKLISEQFKTLRSKLHYLQDPNEKSRVILLTSSVAGEGKSFVSSNLAITLASVGKKTVILELDLRKARLKEIFNLSNTHPGITDFLTKKTSIDEIIQPSGIMPTLDIISSGSIVPNPSELLESNELSILMDHLKEEYDNIIIDSPPVHLVTDSLILARYAHITLYVVRQGFTKKSEMKFIKGLYTDHKMPEMHIIFNGVNNKRYGYGYEYDNVYYV
ncbi:MAG: polysaccharide biosynthesis tyrosine autokinase [Mucilaginibacter sp.]|nr:polysaccharide biosynthesis tyrosine autokinase [Mucilaginibacter sp.]